MNSPKPTSSLNCIQTDSSFNNNNNNNNNQEEQEIKSLTQTCIQIISNFILKISNQNQTDSKLQLQFDLIFNFIFDFNQNQPKISLNQFKPIISSILRSITHHKNQQTIRKHQQSTYCTNQLPFVIYASILKCYQDLTVFNLNTNQTVSRSIREPYSKLVLNDTTKFKILFNQIISTELNQKLNLNFLTILNLSWYTKFSDQDLIIIHRSIKHSLIILRLDFTSITDLGIFNITHQYRSNRLESIPSNYEEFQKDYLSFNNELNWFKLSVLSLKGLKFITDKSLVYLSKFYNLFLIDLNLTSCTSTSRQILNQSIIKNYQNLLTSNQSITLINLKQFHNPKSEVEFQLFSSRLTLTEKFLQFIKSLEMDSFQFELFQINWINQDDQPNQFQSNYQSSKLHETQSFFHKSNQIEPSIDTTLCLIMDYPFKSIQLDPLKNPTNSTNNPIKAKRNSKAFNHLGLDDDLALLNSYKSKKLKN